MVGGAKNDLEPASSVVFCRSDVQLGQSNKLEPRAQVWGGSSISDYGWLLAGDLSPQCSLVPFDLQQRTCRCRDNEEAVGGKPG